MIEISHKQARYLIREVEDRRLPEAQWMALQAHLERCPECRAYRSRIAGLGRDLQRELHQRWGPVSSPAQDLPGQVLARRAARSVRRRQAFYAISGLLFLVVLFGLQWKGQATSLSSTSTAVAVSPSLTPTAVMRFRGLALFEGQQSGNAEVFLLNNTSSAIPDLSNLTNHPAQDSHPIWSPDGEWIAFLSDRSGKRELYVVSVAGTRLTQLTADADIDWQGPLSWSADGQWIGLAGRRLLQNGDRWGYLVPLSGSSPVSLPGTRNMAGNMKFSSTQPLLATPGHVYNTDDGWSFEGWYRLKTEEGRASVWHTARPEYAFDWAVGGSNLAYLGWSQSDSPNPPFFDQIRLSPIIGLNNRESLADGFSQVIDRASGETTFRSLSYMPGGPFLATLQDANKTGCWTIHLVNAFHYNLVDPIDFAGLCVEGDLERASWSSVGPHNAERWLVVAGRLADPETGAPSGEPGIYAIRNSPWSSAYTAVPEFERLLDLPANTASRTVPRLRPTSETLRIQPQAARPVERALVQSLPPLAITESMLLAGRDATRTWESAISIMRGDGAEVILVPEGATNSCPTWSPDGQKIAYRSFQAGRANGIFLMDEDGSRQELAAMEQEDEMGEWEPTYHCPVWSPDGRWMAAVRYEGNLARLVVIDRDKGVLGIFPIDSPSRLARPVWSPDGKTIYLAEHAARVSSAYLVSVPWASLAGPRTLRVLSGWDDVHAMAISPDGRQLALIVVQAARADLMILDLVVHGAGMRVALPRYDPRGVTTPGRVAWLPDGRILIAQPGGPLARAKTLFVTFNPHDSGFDSLAFSEDTLLDWGYQDGWLIYSSESGLWAQDVMADPASLPVRLSSQIISSLELK